MRDLRELNLNSLRIAESAARNQSFVRAAEEQLLTPSAVSQRIRALEAQLRFSLFRRANNSVVLTHEGQVFIERVREALAQIMDARRSIRDPQRETTLYLCALPTFTVRWLFPRLPEFQQKFPDIRLNISTSYSTPNIEREDLDLAIYYGEGSFGEVDATLLFKEDLTPVCRPDLIERLGKDCASLAVRDLKDFTLLHSDTCTLNWSAWLAFAGEPSLVDEARAMHFESCMLSYEAAKSGIGIACANRAYLLSEFENKQLIAPFPILQPNRNGWYLLRSHGGRVTKAMRQFQSWVLTQSEESREQIARLSKTTL